MSIESFGGGFDFGAGGDLTSFAGDVSSTTLDSGSEFLSDGFSGGFDGGGFESLQLQEQVGDFAGNGDWFDANYTGDIVSGPGSSDFLGNGLQPFEGPIKYDIQYGPGGDTFYSPSAAADIGATQARVFGAENVTIGGEFTPGSPDFVGPVQTPLSPEGSEFGTAAEFSGPTANTPLSPEGSEFGTAAEFANYKPPSTFDKLTGQATLLFDKAKSVVTDPAFIKTVAPKVISLVSQPGGINVQSALQVIGQGVNAVNNSPTPVAGTNTTANRNALPTGENTVGPPSPFDPNSPEFNGPPAPVKTTVDPAVVNAAISAITGVNVNQVLALKNSPNSVGVNQVLGVLPGGTNILSAGGNPVLGGAVVVPPLAISSVTNNTSGYNNFTVNANAGTATAFAPAAVGGGDTLAGLQISQLAATTGDPAFKVDVNGIGVLTQDAAITAGLNEQAREQQTARIQTQNAPRTGDWRVRLSLANGSRYLYNAANAGDQARTSSILAPLWDPNGVIFPYTPQISTSYRANYDNYDLTHSNYRGYFYKNSYVDAITIRAKFTAQDTAEANYLLAVIHFFRTVTKMFYGQDAERGSPPPLTFLSGLGDFQFNMHPCVVSSFEYELPDDVDYIRAQVTSNNGTNLLAARNRSTNSPASPGGALTASLIRMITAKITPGAEPGPVPLSSFGTASPDATYVPTKMNINLTLLPIQSRSQVSQLFSVKDFAAGNLLKGGFW
jgi:hypothetical protein